MINVFHNVVTNVGSMFFAVPFVHPNGVWWMAKWDTDCINVNGKSWECDLDLVLRALSKHMPSSWMPNVILVDNAQVESMYWNLISQNLPTIIPCLLIVYYSAYFVAKQNSVVDHTLLHNIFCHKLCLFCIALVFINAWYISCHIDIHRHFIRLFKNLICTVDVSPCNNVWLGAKDFLCLWHVHKARAENVVKKIASAKN
jgi:hypothetical protein